MADTHETIVDIIAEMRGIRVREFQDYADRLDAAHKRERGDAAKLREVLKRAWLFVSATRESFAFVHEGRIERDKLCDDIDAALSAPPRNCDKYSHDEALRIWAAENENERNGCFDEWLYKPATEKEGGEK